MKTGHNLPQKMNISTIFRSAPVTRALVFSSVALSLLGFALRANSPGNTTPLLAMVPAFCLFYPWTFVTAGLHESSLIAVRFWLLEVNELAIRKFSNLTRRLFAKIPARSQHSFATIWWPILRNILGVQVDIHFSDPEFNSSHTF